MLQANLIFPIKLLEMCVEFEVCAFINTDSYVNKPSFQYPYLLDYSLSKKSLLLWLPYFSQKIGIANMILEHVFGPNDGEKKFVTGMVNQIAVEKKPAIELTPGDQVRDFIYVYDVVSAYLRVLECLLAVSEPGLSEYEVGTGTGVDIKSFVEYIRVLSHSPTKLLFGALPYRRAEIMRSVANTNSLKSIGWATKYDWVSGLRDLLQHNE